MIATSEWIGPIGVLMGVVATSAFGLAAAFLTQRWQRTAGTENRVIALREERAKILRDACTRHVAVLNDILLVAAAHPGNTVVGARAAMRALREADPKLFRELEVAEAELNIIGGEAVRSAAGRASRVLGEVFGQVVSGDESARVVSHEFYEAEQELLAAVRAEHAELLV